MGEFRMPSLGADMTEGTLLEWLVQPGDAVHHGQVVAVIDTVKTAIDIEVFEDGEVERLLVEPGTTVQVGTPLALLRGAKALVETSRQPLAGSVPRPLRKERTGISSRNEEPIPPVESAEPLAGSAPRPLRKGRTGISSGSEGPIPPVVTAAPASPIVRHLAHERGVDLAAVVGHGRDGAVTREDVEAASAVVSQSTPATTSPRARHRAEPGRVAASPLARARAAALGVDLGAVTGSGPNGAVTVADVTAAASSATKAGASRTAPTVPVRTAPHDVGAPSAVAPRDAVSADERRAAMQAATGALMARSKREIPHYYLESTIDLAAATAWLSRHNEGRPSAQRVLPSALLLLATARSLRESPELNGFYTDAGFEPSDRVDLGVAVSMRRGGLVVASVRDAAAMTVDEFMAALKGVAERARTGRLRGSEMALPTVTVTNLGDQGADLVHGVIYPPQVALVGFGRVVPRPWAVDGMLTVRPVVVATLAGDHRVSDGHRGSRFLAALDAALQTPEEL